MAYETGTALNNVDFFARLRRFLTGRATFSTVVKTGTGNGLLTLLDSFPTTGTESWTLTCTAASPNSGTFSVVGTVSGTLAPATVGVPYTNAKLSFTITDGTVDYTVGATFQFTTTIGALTAQGQAWEQNRYTGTELMVKGKGLAGTDAIYVNMSLYTDTGADVHNILIQGAVGYVNANAVDDQPASSPKVGLSLWNDAMQYWIIANGRRFIIVCKVSTSYVSGYFGFILPYATPTQYPYPLVIAGNIPTGEQVDPPPYLTRNYSWASGLNSNYWSPRSIGDVYSTSVTTLYTRSAFHIYWLDGDWEYYHNMYATNNSGGETRNALPQGQNMVAPIQPEAFRGNLDGGYQLIPHTLLHTTPSSAVLGELDGSFYISGFSNGSENTVTVGGDTYLVVQNVHRSAVKDFAAIKLA